jgi:hypothetical protein
MSLPRVLSLADDGALCSAVAPEVDALREGVLCHAAMPLDDETAPLPQAAGDQIEILARFEVGSARRWASRCCARPMARK